MKTLLAASALIFVSNVATADWEDAWKNPDLDPKYGIGYDIEFAPGSPSLNDVAALGDYYRGNADVTSDVRSGSAQGKGSGAILVTSLDRFTQGNSDQYDGVDAGFGRRGIESGMDIRGIGDDTRSF